MEHMFDSDETSSSDPLGVGQANTVLRKAITTDLATVDGDTLRLVALNLETLRRSLDTLSLRVLSQMDARKITDRDEGMQTGTWLAHKAGLPTGPSRNRVHVANKIRLELPEADKALADGRIDYEHARVLANAANPRIVDQFAKIVNDLIDLVPHMTFARWRREVSAVADLLDEDGGHRPGDDITDNTMSMSAFLDNTIVLNGQLTGEFALTVRDALGARADKLFKQFSRDAELTSDLPIPPRRTLLALALVELIREGLARDPKSTVPAQPEVSLIINADDPNKVTDVDGIRIGDTGRFTSMCDPVFRPVVMNTEGIVIDVGRGQRLATAAQRRAMAHRDGGCVWPGCDGPASWTDAHHVHHWSNGGSTDLASLASLCRYHHGVTHRNGWTMGVTEDQYFWWRSPNGTIFHSQRHQQGHHQGRPRQHDGSEHPGPRPAGSNPPDSKPPRSTSLNSTPSGSSPPCSEQSGSIPSESPDSQPPNSGRAHRKGPEPPG